MNRIVLGALLLSMLNIAGTAVAASAGATMEVGFVVKESCTVQLQDDARNAAPIVACGYASPYQVSRQVQAPAPEQASVQADGQTWQITF